MPDDVLQHSQLAIDYCVAGYSVYDPPGAGAADQYAGIQGELITGATEENLGHGQKQDGIISKLRVHVIQSTDFDDPIGTETIVELMLNGVATSLRIQIPANTTNESFENVDDVVIFEAGDRLTWHIEYPSASEGSASILAYIAAEIQYV